MADQIRFTPVQVFDANGDPVAGAKAYFYQTGTTTPLTTYADEGLTTPHPNPLVAVGNVFPAVFVSASVKAKVDVTDAADVRLNGYPIDPATIHTGGAGAGTISFSATAENPNTNVQDAIDAVSHPWTTAATEDLARAAMGVAIGTDVQAHDASLDDLAGITFAAGDILYHDGTNLKRLPKGTDKQVLALAGGLPVWSKPGAWEIIETIDPKNVAAVDITSFDATTYSDYRLVFHNVRADSADRNFQILFSADGGSTFKSTTYDWVGFTIGDSFTANTGARDTSVIVIAENVGSTDDKHGLSGDLGIFNPAAAKPTWVQGFASLKKHSPASPRIQITSGSRIVNEVTNAVRLLWSAGNFHTTDAGEIVFLGLRK